MIKFFSKPFRWAKVYAALLTLSVAFVLLDTFVIPQTIAGPPSDLSAAGAESAGEEETDSVQTVPVVTATSYEDDNIRISIETVRKYDSDLYVADIQISDASYLKTAFANDSYGRNIKDTTSDIAQDHNAIFAVNGDYYGFRSEGFVLRNGILYRFEASKSAAEALVIDKEGDLSIVSESGADAQSLADDGAWQILSFGPALVNHGEIVVTADGKLKKARTENPRTAIGQVSVLHYIVIVSDGRTDESAGLSLYELAQEFYDRGCSIAYNLDGGGSSTMWFNGTVINHPTDGRSSSERSISDIVYFG